MGQIECDRSTFVKGNFIPKKVTIKSLTANSIVLKFQPFALKV